MRKVGQRLEQDLDHDRQVVVGRVELVQLQQGQVGLQVVPGNIFVTTMLKSVLGRIVILERIRIPNSIRFAI